MPSMSLLAQQPGCWDRAERRVSLCVFELGEVADISEAA